MGLDERFGWMFAGCVIGFIFGYIVRALREIKSDLVDVKEELDEVDDLMKEHKENHSKDDGFMGNRVIADALMVLVLILVVLAAIFSQRASNDAEKSLEKTDRVSVCNQRALSETIIALNQRTTYNREQASANVELQKAQAEFFALILQNPQPSEKVRRDAAFRYLRDVENFVKASETAEEQAVLYPFPTNSQLKQCVDPNEFPTEKEPIK